MVFDTKIQQLLGTQHIGIVPGKSVGFIGLHPAQVNYPVDLMVPENVFETPLGNMYKVTGYILIHNDTSPEINNYQLIMTF